MIIQKALPSLGLFLAASTLLLLHTNDATARPRATVKQQTFRAENPKQNGKETLILPYAFATDGLGTVAGVGAMAKGYYQPQLLIGGTVYGGLDEDTKGFILGAWDFQIPGANRFFLSAVGSYGHYPNQRAYAQATYQPGEVRPGSNDSDKNDYSEAGGDNNWFDVRLEYVLPLGSATNTPIMEYKVKNGMLVEGGSGGEVWNPLTSGITTLLLRQYGQTESFEFDEGDVERSTYPVEFALSYNNTDFPTNPSIGSSQYISFKRDFGLGDAETWSFLEFEASKYFSFGASEYARQRVLAVNFWTGDALSWDEEENSDGSISLNGNPPQYEGANLGGFYRMRAYPSRRFHDRSVIYTTAEYRYTPKWNPVGNAKWLSWLKMDWWQFVGFVEGGRVANEYTVDELFSDWKYDVGVGLRAYMATGVIRLDLATSDEESAMWLMFSHPF